MFNCWPLINYLLIFQPHSTALQPSQESSNNSTSHVSHSLRVSGGQTRAHCHNHWLPCQLGALNKMTWCPMKEKERKECELCRQWNTPYIGWGAGAHTLQCEHPAKSVKSEQGCRASGPLCWVAHTWSFQRVTSLLPDHSKCPSTNAQSPAKNANHVSTPVRK